MLFTSKTIIQEVAKTISIVLPRWLEDSYPPGVVYRKTLNLYRKFQSKFKITQYFVTIVRLHFQWLDFYIKIHGMTGKQCACLPKRLEKVSFF